MIYFLKHLLHFPGVPYRYDQLFAEVKKVRPKNIMEIGVWTGERARKMIGVASRFHPKGSLHYYGFDLFESMDNEKFTKEVSKQPPTIKIVEEKLKKTRANIHLYKGDTVMVLPDQEATLPKMDIVFIDGGHSLETIANDWFYVSKLLHQGSVVIFDDYWQNRLDAGSKVTVDLIDKEEYSVVILPIIDSFPKTAFGHLSIQLAKVTKL